MDSNKFKTLIWLVIALFGAIYLGISSATAQIETIAWFLFGGTLLTCLALGSRIWMIIPFMGALNLTLMIPGQPNTTMLANAVFIGFCSLLFLMRKLPYRLAFTELGFWTLALFLCVLQAYIRNPVGLNIFGGDSLGGRPYALLVAVLLSSILLSIMKIPVPDLKWILRLSIFGGLVNFGLLTIGHFMPRVGIWYGAVAIDASNAEGMQQGSYGQGKAGRIPFARDFASNLSLWISSYVSPIRACFHPLWVQLVLVSLVLAALSGYRTDVATVGLTFMIAIALRGGITSVTASCLVVAMGLVVLAFVNLVAPLPGNLQRSLSILPGTWDKIHLEDTGESTEWRVEMWKEALLTQFWIKNKILGDGLGMSREEYNYMLSFKTEQLGGGVGSGKLTRQQEFMIASGNYHSGPVSTVRSIGYLGLFILMLAQIRLAVHAHRQIQRARNTEWFPLTLFVGIPLIASPIIFVFIFGAFGSAAASFLMGAAMVRVLENNLPVPAYVKRVRRPFFLQSENQTRLTQQRLESEPRER
jgi:hypothetical protein